jgi:hypothetical protein
MVESIPVQHKSGANNLKWPQNDREREEERASRPVFVPWRTEILGFRAEVVESREVFCSVANVGKRKHEKRERRMCEVSQKPQVQRVG